ncbi:flagellar basal body-associated FliL family protein [Succinimonas sp.]|uniref:flagellar basal body-associated FliL family protein n=1 Tax=Succinimonas sp. TaxID=1936151 RepID=UPI003864C8ED
MKGFRKTAAVLLTMLLTALTMLALPAPAAAQDSAPAPGAGPITGYYEIKGAITTNLSSTGNKLNYISVNVTISLTDSRDYELVQKHEPMIKDAITDTLGAITLKQIDEPGSRNTIRDKVREVVIRLLDDCVGRRIVKDVMFSDFKWQ